MTRGKKLAISAVMGMLGAAAAFGSAQADANVASAGCKSGAASGAPPGADKAGCGNHDGGKCGSMVTNGHKR